MDKTSLLILLLSGLLIAALFLSRLSERLKMPDILWFMLLGLLLGPSGLGLISGSHGMEGNGTFLMGAVAVVLYEAGVRTRLERIRRHLIGIGLLVTIGLLMTAFLLGIGGKLLFGFPLYQGILLGAILATTDPASILPILRRLKLPPSITETLIAESALGDVTGSMMTMFILAYAAPDGSGWKSSMLPFFGSVVWGAGLGIGLGALVRILVTHPKLGIFRENVPVLMIAALLAGFSLTGMLHGQILLCAYVFGIMVGRMTGSSGPEDPEKVGSPPESFASLKTVNDLLAYLASFFIFLVMGTLIPRTIGGLSPLHLLVFVLLLVLVIRPLVVFTLTPLDRVSRYTLREMVFMSVVRETGIMAGALLGLAHDRLPPSAPLIVFVVVVSTIVIGSIGSAPVARALGFGPSMDRPGKHMP